MNDRVEPTSGVVVVENYVTQGGSIKGAVLTDNILPEFSDNLGQAFRSDLDDFSRELVCINDDGTMLGETLGDCGFSGGDSASEPYMKNSGHGSTVKRDPVPP